MENMSSKYFKTKRKKKKKQYQDTTKQFSF